MTQKLVNSVNDEVFLNGSCSHFIPLYSPEQRILVAWEIYFTIHVCYKEKLNLSKMIIYALEMFKF